MKQGAEMDELWWVAACEIVALIAVVAGHIVMPKAPVPSWEAALQLYLTDSTISN